VAAVAARGGGQWSHLTRPTWPWPPGPTLETVGPMTDTDGRSDFDFLHGSWAIHNRRLDRPLAGSTEWREFASTAIVRPILHGLGNADTITVPDLPGVGAFEGATLRLFDPEARRWSIFRASTRRPGHLDPPLVGRFVDGHAVFDGEDSHDGIAVAVRFHWDRDGDRSARWEQSLANLGGELDHGVRPLVRCAVASFVSLYYADT
jgi:hypothetical protein